MVPDVSPSSCAQQSKGVMPSCEQFNGSTDTACLHLDMQTQQTAGVLITYVLIRLQDGLFMIVFSEPHGAIEWAVVLQLALLR